MFFLDVYLGDLQRNPDHLENAQTGWFFLGSIGAASGWYFRWYRVATGFVGRGYSVAEVSERLGISTKSLYTWRAQFSQPRKQINESTEQAAEIRRLKKELARVSEERDILKKATAYFARDAK